MTATNPTTTNLKGDEANRGWVLYDGDCALCRNSARRYENLLGRHGFDLTPLQTPWVRERFHFQADAAFDEMIVLLPGNQAFGGADGIVQIARRIWWAWPLFALVQIPGTMILLRKIYRRLAANRNCFGNTCQLPNRKNQQRKTRL